MEARPNTPNIRNSGDPNSRATLPKDRQHRQQGQSADQRAEGRRRGRDGNRRRRLALPRHGIAVEGAGGGTWRSGRVDQDSRDAPGIGDAGIDADQHDHCVRGRHRQGEWHHQRGGQRPADPDHRAAEAPDEVADQRKRDPLRGQEQCEGVENILHLRLRKSVSETAFPDRDACKHAKEDGKGTGRESRDHGNPEERSDARGRQVGWDEDQRCQAEPGQPCDHGEGHQPDCRECPPLLPDRPRPDRAVAARCARASPASAAGVSRTGGRAARKLSSARSRRPS